MSVTAEAPVSVSDPFGRGDFRADLGALASSVREDWQRWAQQAVLIARMAALVPAEHGIVHHGTPWKSFVREIAVARRCTDQAAAKEVFVAITLVRDFPRALALLEAGQLPAYSAKVLIEESVGCEPRVLAALDDELSEKACRLSAARIRDNVRKIELRHDPDAAAARSASAASVRGARVYPGRDDQASLIFTGPVLPIMQFYEGVTAAARAARAAGDTRTLDNLRFDLALDVTGTETDTETDTDTDTDTIDMVADAPAASDADRVETPTDRDGVVPAWVGDRRRVRPIKILIHLPVTTALGLDNEPGWLPGYGWISAPQCRQWMTAAELHQVCVGSTGFVVDVADRVVRPDPTPRGVRDAVLAMIRDPGPITEKTWRLEDRHDPSPALAGFVDIRDVFCDGPTGTRVPAARCHADHEQPYPDGPTAAWNLKDRAGRTHLLKHAGWTPLRTATSTLWFSPAGQVVEVPHHTGPPPDLDPDAQLPDPDELHAVDAAYLRLPGPGDHAPFAAPPPPPPPPTPPPLDLDDCPF